MLYSPYSISKLGTYNQCPKKFKFHYIDKVKIPFGMSVALYKGSHIHLILENNFNYNIEFKTNDIYTTEEFNKTIEIVKKFENSDLGKKYKKIIPQANLEEDFAFNTKLELVDFKSKDAWIRGSADLYLKIKEKAYIWDYKSGKDKSEDETFGIDQSMAYSIYMFIKYPDVNIVKAIFCFVEHQKEKAIIYKRENIRDYLKHFYNLTKNVENDKSHKANISPLCDYCDFEKFDYCKERHKLKELTNNFMTSKIEF